MRINADSQGKCGQALSVHMCECIHNIVHVHVYVYVCVCRKEHPH